MKQGFLLLRLKKKMCGASLGQREEKGKKEGRKGEKEEFSVHVIRNALACYPSPIHMPHLLHKQVPDYSSFYHSLCLILIYTHGI